MMRFGVSERLTIPFVLGEPYLGDRFVVGKRGEIGEVVDAVIVGDKADPDVLGRIGSRQSSGS